MLHLNPSVLFWGESAWNQIFNLGWHEFSVFSVLNYFSVTWGTVLPCLEQTAKCGKLLHRFLFFGLFFPAKIFNDCLWQYNKVKQKQQEIQREREETGAVEPWQFCCCPKPKPWVIIPRFSPETGLWRSSINLHAQEFYMCCTLRASILINSGNIFDVIVGKGISAILEHSYLNWWEINSVVSDCLLLLFH